MFPAPLTHPDNIGDGCVGMRKKLYNNLYLFYFNTSSRTVILERDKLSHNVGIVCVIQVLETESPNPLCISTTLTNHNQNKKV